MSKTLIVAAALAAALWLGAGRAGATNECRGFQACVSVAGPWVTIGARTAASSRWDLVCPKRFIVGGVDALVSDRAVDVGFVANVGGPVTPGVATTTDAVVVGTYTGKAPRPTSFRPFIGCIPTSGGGGRETTAAHAARAGYPVGQPVIRRAGALRLRPGLDATVQPTCVANERLVSASVAVGFWTSQPPPPALAASVHAALEGAVVQISTTAALPRTTVAQVQVLALCAGP
jgi:hypothetical protein